MQPARNGIQLVSDRLVLREFVVTDEDAVHSFAADPLVTRFTDWGPNSIEDTRAFLAEATAQATNPERAEFTLTQSTRAPAGSSDQWRSASPAFNISEASSASCSTATSDRRDTPPRRPISSCGSVSTVCSCGASAQHATRTTTARVLEKAGLQYEGRIRSHLFVRGAWRDSLLYAAVNSNR
jgi:[ribosomal protein S5]-alanine N-acetyltransferase